MKKPRRLAPFLAAATLLSALAPDGARAQLAPQVDPGFNARLGIPGQVRELVRQPDGKLLIAGRFSLVHGVPRRGVARLNADGSLDAGFDAGPVTYGYVSEAALLPDGKIVVCGAPGEYFGTKLPALVRLDADGRLDPGFTAPLDLVVARRLALRPDGGLLVDGQFADARYRLLRLNPDGSLAATLAVNRGEPMDFLDLLALQPDGRALITDYAEKLERLNADGAADNSFRLSLGDNVVYTDFLALQPDGRLLVRAFDGNTTTDPVLRLNSDGSRDGGFRADLGPGNAVNVFRVALQSDGRILFGGYDYRGDAPEIDFVRRLNADGSFDAGYAVSLVPAPDLGSGNGFDGESRALLAAPDGRAFVAGNFFAVNGLARPGLARLNLDGSPDPAFDAGLESDLGVEDGRAVTALVTQPDGRILVGGAFNLAGGRSRNGVARLNADGTLDPGFNPGVGADGRVGALARQADGRLLVGGAFQTFDSRPHHGLARLDADGRLDDDFRPDVGTSATDSEGGVLAIVPQPDGRILLVGNFRQVNGTPRRGLARLNADGSLDDGFPSGTGPARGRVLTAALLGDGSVLVAGDFAIYDGVPRAGLARLDAASGRVLDGGYQPLTNSEWRTLAPQADGKVLVGGFAPAPTAGASGYRAPVFRLNADGSLDAGFDASTLDASRPGFESVRHLAVLPDGGVVAATTQRLLRLNPDGSVARGFDLGESNYVQALAVAGNGQTLLGGEFSFSGANGGYGAAVVRLREGGPVPPAFFNGGVDLGGSFSFLSTFGYYKLLPQAGYVLHNDLGFLYYLDANDGKGGAYFYDFATTAGGQSLGFFYTSPALFPYLYSFGLNTFVYYFPDPRRGTGFYTTAPRVFSRLDTGEVLFR